MRAITFFLLGFSLALAGGCSPETKTTDKNEPGKTTTAERTSDSDSSVEAAASDTAETSKLLADDVLNEAIAQAKSSEKKLFVHFSADW